jgi:DNA-directed RNA polymerase subunit RPC12/RpoP
MTEKFRWLLNKSIDIYTELTGIDKFKKPEQTDSEKDKDVIISSFKTIEIDWNNHPDYFLFLCPHCHKEFNADNEDSLLNDLQCPHCGKNVSVHHVVSSGNFKLVQKDDKRK